MTGDAVAALVRQGVLVADRVGPSLGDLRRARVPLTDGEAATVAISLARALDALHDEGLAYGPPSAADVTFELGGRPVLVVPPAWAASPDDDVPGLLRLILAVMSPVRVDDEPDLCLVLEGLLARGCRSGVEVAEACFDSVEAEPVHLPDAGALARASLLGPSNAARGARAAASPVFGAADRPTLAAPPGAADRPTARVPLGAESTRPSGSLPRALGLRSPRAATGRRATRRRDRRRSRVRTGGVLVVALAIMAAVLLRPGAGRADAETIQSPAGAALDPVLDRHAPGAAAAALTRMRAVIVGSGDAVGLDAVDALGGPALDADEDLLASLGGDLLEGLSVDVQATNVIDGSSDDEATVAVASAMSPYTRVGESGTRAITGTTPRTVVLRLRWTDGGWRVWDVGEPAS